MITILEGDALATLATLQAGTFQTCVTSPPYYGLRDYGCAGQIGLEPTPEAYIARMVAVMREVRRVLRDDGTLWLNIGDSYASAWSCSRRNVTGNGAPKREERQNRLTDGLKEKDLLGIPWQLAFALRADGWYLRSEIIWHKPNPMPESVRDRPTKAHEQVFLLSKAPRYFYDADAVAEPALQDEFRPSFRGGAYVNNATFDNSAGGRSTDTGNVRRENATRNARTVWTIATQPYSGAHFATMPPDLAERCVKAGSRAGDAVLDPFGGAGTTGLVADRLRRDATLIELNPTYATLARRRVLDDAPLLARVTDKKTRDALLDIAAPYPAPLLGSDA